jgi:hypothetical protein
LKSSYGLDPELAYKAFAIDRLPHEGKITAIEVQRIFEEFLDGEVSSRRINAPGYFEYPKIRTAYLNCLWKGLSNPSIMPEKPKIHSI